MWQKFKKYFLFFKGRVVDRNLTRNFRMIYFSRITINSATQLMGLFLPIFLYQFLNFDLRLVIIYYLVIDFLYGNLVALGCKYIMNRLGIHRSLQISVLFGAAYYFIFIIINHYIVGDNNLFTFSQLWWLAPALFFSLLFRLTHWIPFHTHLAKLTDHDIRAGQLSLLEATMMALGAMMPIVGGVVLSYLGYNLLFVMALSIYLISLLPFSQLPKIEENFSWTYQKTWKNFFSKKTRSSIIAHAGDGAENIIGAIIWPIFLWQLLEGNYFQVGTISSFIILATIILQVLTGDLMDKLPNRRRWLRYGSIFYAGGWLLKALIGSAFQVFLFSTYHNMSRVFSRTSFDALNYDIAADQGHYVDEYTVLREMAMMMGKIIMGLFILIIIPFFSLRYIFILAALASLSMNLLKQGEAFKD